MTKITIKLNGEEKSFAGDPSLTIYDSAQEKDIETPFACTSGSCHACKAKVLSGEVDRGLNDTVDDQERQEGLILTCQAKPLSDISLDFDSV